jgi:hypothetical protein
MVRGTFICKRSSWQLWWEARSYEKGAHNNDSDAPEPGAHGNDGKRHVHLNKELITMIVRDKYTWTYNDGERHVHLNRKPMPMMVTDTCTWTESQCQWWWQTRAHEQEAHDNDGERHVPWTESYCQWWWEVHATEQEAHDNDSERHVHLNRKLMSMMVRGTCTWTGSS